MDKDELKELIKQGNFSEALKHDQLRKQQEEGNVFKNFLEGEITFPPTYKYDLFSDDYDTSEKCRAPAWTDRVLWRRRSPLGAQDEKDQGRLVYYGRAELKQSDHRPVIALVDVEARRVDESRRQQCFYEVIGWAGPPDATVVVSAGVDEDETVFEDDLTMALLEELAPFGDTVLVRFVANTMWITFRDGQAALEAVNKTKGKLRIQDYDLTMALRTPNWVELAKEEIRICSDNTIPLFTTPSQSEYNCLGIPEVKSQQANESNAPPSRPPPPPSKSAGQSPRRAPPPKAGVISIPSAAVRRQPPLTLASTVNSTPQQQNNGKIV
nr:unnamed protein product [Callosobruchus chinensis]